MLVSHKQQESRKELVGRLTEVLADSYVLFNTTQFCHWNVVGPDFKPLHEMFETQYRSLFEAIDKIAERIRVLGYATPGTLADYTALSNVKQQPNLVDPQEMLQALIEGHDLVAARLERAIEASRDVGDDATEDLLIERLREHEKTSWMLRAQSGEKPDKLALQHSGATPTRRKSA